MTKIRITHKIFRYPSGKRIYVTVRPVNNIRNEVDGAHYPTTSGAYKKAKSLEEKYRGKAKIEKYGVNPNKIKK